MAKLRSRDGERKSAVECSVAVAVAVAVRVCALNMALALTRQAERVNGRQ